MTSSPIWSVDRDRFTEPPLRICPRGVCDNCRRFDYVPLQPGNECCWCRQILPWTVCYEIRVWKHRL